MSSIRESKSTETKLQIVREASASGARLVGVLDVGLSTGDRLGTNLAMFFGGSVGTSAAQVFQFDTNGVQHLYVQPFSDVLALPGEHHVWLGGTVRQPAVFVDASFGGSWQAPSDPALAAALQQDPALKSLVFGDWEWRVGTSRAKRTWLVQVRPLGGGNTHLAMAGVGAGELTPRAGFVELQRACGAMNRYVMNAAIHPTPFVHPTAYGPLYESLLAGQPLPFERSATAPVDMGHAIVQTLQPAAGGPVHVGLVPPPKEQNARFNVMPPAARHLPIVALIDLTVFGSAKEAFVLTPTHGFLKGEGLDLAFAWADVRGVEPPKDPHDDAVTVRIAPLGDLVLPAVSRAGTLAQLFAACAEVARASA